MAQLILSFFASIGIILLMVELCDFFFYRKYRIRSVLIIDFTQKNEQEIIQILELLASLRRKSSGKAVLGNIEILSENFSQKEDFIYHYARIFQLPICVKTKKNTTSEKD